MKAKVSIIVPSYNRASYIKTCLASLQNQSLRDVEIIVIDDGSTDKTSEIVQALAAKDPRIMLVRQPQSGVAAARNNGLKHATAPYIMFCDSDDFFKPNMCQRMLDTIEKTKVDVVACTMELVYQDDSEQKDIEDYVKLKFEGKHRLDFEKIIFTDVSLPTKIFKKSLIDQYQMTFPVGLYFEDAFFCDQYFSIAKNIYYLNEKLYNYVRHNNSIMSQSFRKNPIAIDYLKVIVKTYDFFKKQGIFKAQADLFWHRFIQYYTFSYDNSPFYKHPSLKRWAKRFVRQHQAELSLAAPHIQKDLRKILKHRFSLKERCYQLAPIRFLWHNFAKPLKIRYQKIKTKESK